MPVDPALIEEVRALAAGDNKPSGLEALDTMPALLGYTIAIARTENHDECDAIEVLCRAARFEKHRLRAYEAALRPLGYTKVADRLRQLARLRRCE